MNFKNLCRYVFGLDLAKHFEYRQLIRALMFLVNTRSDICFVVNAMSQFVTEPLHAQWVVSKQVFRYLHGTINLGLRYTSKDVRLNGYTDVDWDGNVIDRKRAFGCYFSFGSSMISWMSRKQNFVALSMAKVEYVFSGMASCEVVWLRKLFEDLFEKILDTIVIYCDNKSGI